MRKHIKYSMFALGFLLLSILLIVVLWEILNVPIFKYIFFIVLVSPWLLMVGLLVHTMIVFDRTEVLLNQPTHQSLPSDIERHELEHSNIEVEVDSHTWIPTLTQDQIKKIIYIWLGWVYFFAFLHGLRVSWWEFIMTQILLFLIISHFFIFIKTIFSTINQRKTWIITYIMNIFICIGIFETGEMITYEWTTWWNSAWIIWVLGLSTFLCINSIFMLRWSRIFRLYNSGLLFCIWIVYFYQWWIIWFQKGVNWGIYDDVFFTRKLFLLISVFFILIWCIGIIQYISSRKS